MLWFPDLLPRFLGLSAYQEEKSKYVPTSPKIQELDFVLLTVLLTPYYYIINPMILFFPRSYKDLSEAVLDVPGTRSALLEVHNDTALSVDAPPPSSL